MQLVHEDKANIPAESAESFVEFEQDGKTVFMHKDLAESKKSTFRTQGQLTKLSGQFEEVKTSLSSFQTKHEQQIAAAAAEAEEKALAKFKEDNNFDGAMQVQAEKFGNQIKSLQEKLNAEVEGRVALESSIIEGKKDSLATKVANAYAPPEFAESVAELLKLKRMKAVDGELAFTNASGEAVELDMETVVESLYHDKFFKPYAKAPASKPGYPANGGGGSGGKSKLMNRGDFERLSAGEKSAFMKSGGKIA